MGLLVHISEEQSRVKMCCEETDIKMVLKLRIYVIIWEESVEREEG